MTHPLAWIAAHPSECVQLVVNVGVLLSLVTAATPRAAQRVPVLGAVVRFCARFGALTHRDEPGTLKWPGVALAAVEATRDALVPPAPDPRGPRGGTTPVTRAGDERVTAPDLPSLHPRNRPEDP